MLLKDGGRVQFVNVQPTNVPLARHSLQGTSVLTTMWVHIEQLSEK
jgi:hypothetical protein